MKSHPLSIDVFFKNKKTRNYHQKEGCGHNRKNTLSDANGYPMKYYGVIVLLETISNVLINFYVSCVFFCPIL